ncbi:hypothetical protein BUALT_Bualt16G0020100 [Buddleja alternifolia]|uniref:Calmodulin-binding domain-containing protein n=1 Tax=Buddleja alternifolia TaxID=168488 RepID=A0AAV6WEK6_9LAMI|nr:hypothetical protein BUALT_Bualt16G0020100 [Buddleja alternifolia]
MGEESIDPLVIPQKNEEESTFMAEESIDPLVIPQKNEESTFMAEESIDPLVIPQISEFDGGNLSENSAENPGSLSNEHNNHAHNSRSSIGSNHTGDSSKSYSIEKPDSPQIKRIVPRYLRASTGSCHDFCKYGRKHVSEEKPWKPLRKRSTKPSSNELNSVQISISGKQMKEKVNKKHSPEVKPSLETKSCSPKVKTSLDAKTYSPRQNGLSSNGPRLSKYKPSPIKKSPSSGPPEIMKMGFGILLPSEKGEVQVKEGCSVDNKMSTTEKKTDDQPVESFSSVKPKEQVKAKPSSSSDKSDSGKGKMIASRAYAKKTLPPSVATSSTKISPNKIASNKARKTGKIRLASPLKGRNAIHEVETEMSQKEVPEKTLHVIMSGTEDNGLKKNTSLSHTKSQSLPVVEENDADIELVGNEEKNVSIEIVNVQPVKENHKKTLRKSKMVVSEDKYKSPVKLKFRSGKVVDLQSDNNIPRRLKFRRARVGNNEAANEFVSNKTESAEIGKVQLVKENQNKTILRKNKFVVSEDKYRSPIKLIRTVKVAGPQSDTNIPLRLKFRRAKPARTEDAKGDTSRRIFRKGAVKNGAVGAVLPSEKVILKRQNVQGKKDAQGLFNNVIEETASKLVESRKSKVKALVGAFETVISLQECKPST